MTGRRNLSGRALAAVTMLHLAWEADRKRSILSFILFGLQALSGSLFALWLKLLLNAVVPSATTTLVIAAGGLIASLAGSTALSHAGNRVRLELREHAHNLVERRLIDLVGRTPTLEIHEHPENLTHLEILERQSWLFGETVPSLINIFALAVRVITTAVILLSVDPLLLLLPLFGLPALLLSAKTGYLYDIGNERASEALRRSGHMYDLATKAESAKEVRLFRLGHELSRRFQADYDELICIQGRVAVQAETLGLASRLVFLIGYVGAIVLVVTRAVHGHASVGDVALTAVLAGQVLNMVTGSSEILQFAGRSLAIASRYVQLQAISNRARQRMATAPVATPTALTDGVRLDNLTSSYPGARQPTLRDINLHLPAGATITIVGDNGAGKTTLVKLLVGLYLPTEGRITVDGIDLTAIDPDRWRQRLSASFQDFARFEFLLREAVGMGDLAHLNNPNTIESALRRGGAPDLIDALPRGLNTQLGPNWNNGIDLSGGQWQKTAIGRAMMRSTPLLLLLDEPTAALDADTEHQLFQNWTDAAKRLRHTTGAITLLVSHRFSTVRMADLIVVLDHGEIIQTGSHEQLIAETGPYSELFELQARSYR